MQLFRSKPHLVYGHSMESPTNCRAGPLQEYRVRGAQLRELLKESRHAGGHDSHPRALETLTSTDKDTTAHTSLLLDFEKEPLSWLRLSLRIFRIIHWGPRPKTISIVFSEQHKGFRVKHAVNRLRRPHSVDRTNRRCWGPFGQVPPESHRRLSGGTESAAPLQVLKVIYPP